MVRPVDEEQHDRARAEVERNALRDVITWMTPDRQREPALLDAAHPIAATPALRAIIAASEYSPPAPTIDGKLSTWVMWNS